MVLVGGDCNFTLWCGCNFSIIIKLAVGIIMKKEQNTDKFIKEICDKGNFDGHIIKIKLGDIQRIADKLFGEKKTKATVIENCVSWVGNKEIPTDHKEH